MAKENKIHELEFTLIPKSSTKFTAVDGKTGKQITDVKLYLRNPSNDRSPAYRPGTQIPVAPGRHKAVLFAPGYEITEVELQVKKEAVDQPFTWKMNPAPEVKIDFSAATVAQDGKAQLTVGYDRYPFVALQKLPFEYRQGKGEMTVRLDTRQPLTLAVNDLNREMRFPGTVHRHAGRETPAVFFLKSPVPYVYAGKLKDGIVAEARRPAMVFWMPEIPEARSTPIGYVSVSQDGSLAARLTPGTKYRRFLRCASADPADQGKSRHETDRYYQLDDFVVPETGRQTAPETVNPAREITRREAYALVGDWVF